MALTLSSANWVDTNTRFTQTNLSDRLSDSHAIIYSSLFNLFNCVPGQRGRIFESTYGSNWMSFLQEPINDQTAQAMELGMFQSIKRWEPRVKLVTGKSGIIPDLNIPGYRVHLAFYIGQGSTLIHSMDFNLKAKV